MSEIKEMTIEDVINTTKKSNRKSDSKPGLYDIVNKQFYTNAGSGEFSFPEYTI